MEKVVAYTVNEIKLFSCSNFCNAILMQTIRKYIHCTFMRITLLKGLCIYYQSDLYKSMVLPVLSEAKLDFIDCTSKMTS